MPKTPTPKRGILPEDAGAETAVVKEPIINSPYDEPGKHWKIHPHQPPELINQRRPPTYFYSGSSGNERGVATDIPLVGEIRKRLAEWRPLALRGEGGVTRVTMDLLNYWRREGRDPPLFFAQLEAAETVIFLNEARSDFLQGLDIPQEKPQEKGKRAFDRKCCKMATGSGKTMVMAMLAAWSILNKVSNRQNKDYSDAVLVVCPNVTIRDRLAELDPQLGEASIYRSRDLVPPALMPQMRQGKVLVRNWHLFEAQSSPRRMTKIGKRVVTIETIRIGEKTHTARGWRYMTENELRRQAALGYLTIISEANDEASGALQSVQVRNVKYIESDRALVERLLKKAFGGQKNILVFNDEAHHAYRLQEEESDLLIEEEDADYYCRQATVWVEGLDKIHSQRGINQCVDFSATPYFLQRAGKNANRIFPWTVSSFGLEDAIEAGLVKVPQLATRDSTGAKVPGYFNIWNWIMDKLSPAERGGKRAEPRPEAILKYAHTPLAMLGGLWEKERQQWEKDRKERPPVYIIVCKTTRLAKVMYEWLAKDTPPSVNIPKAQLPSLVNKDGQENTIRVDSKVAQEAASGSQDDEVRWMRHTLDTVGKTAWQKDSQGRNILPEEFAELVEKRSKNGKECRHFLEYPPGRDVRCIISVSMLTEGWDCNTVTHIIGLRPFMSQLLCEQVIGRGLRRASYDVQDNGLMDEEIATVLGVPLTSFPVKATGAKKVATAKKHRIYALPERQEKFEIAFPRVEGYYQCINHRVICNMDEVAPLHIDGTQIPTTVDVRAALLDSAGMPAVHGPGEDITLTLEEYRKRFRMQKGMFDMAEQLVEHFLSEDSSITANVLFRQIYRIIGNYIDQKVDAVNGAQPCDAFTAAYYSEMISNLSQAIKPDADAGECPELPRYEQSRPIGSSGDVDFWTKRTPYSVNRSHVNAVAPDTKRLEQATAFALDQHEQVQAFVKNEGMGFAIPYLKGGSAHDYMPDFIVRLENGVHLILETKGYDPDKDLKATAAQRWVNAVNADGKHGKWAYAMISEVRQLEGAISKLS